MPQLHPAKTDIAVLLLFFNRPSTFKLVFEEVKKARPSRLFLYQDGPRGEKDMAGIEACRKIVEDIDWECDVRRNFQTRNYGCDPSGYMAHKWAFSLADKCIVLEDDVVPSQSFFPFCKEMLDRYENDERITMVAGFNTDEVTTDVPYSYFFTSVFSIWGWASWRRVIDKWDDDYKPEELTQIFMMAANKRKYILPEDTQQAVSLQLKYMYDNRDRNFGNARTANNFFDAVRQAMATRLMQAENLSANDMSTILPEAT